MSKFFCLDANHKLIKKHLEDLRNQVIDFAKAGDGFPDLMVVNRNKLIVLIEIKFGKESKIKKSQMKFIGNYKGLVGFAETVEEAEKLANEPTTYALPQNIKDKIAAHAKTFTEKQQKFSTFKTEIGI